MTELLFCASFWGYLDCRAKEKSQELDEGVPRVPDMRSQREQIESASPIAFAESPHLARVHAEFQLRGQLRLAFAPRPNYRIYN